MTHNGMKQCFQCKQVYPATPEYFHRNKWRTDGLRAICKECAIERSITYQRTHRDKVNEYQRSRRKQKREQAHDAK